MVHRRLRASFARGVPTEPMRPLQVLSKISLLTVLLATSSSAVCAENIYLISGTPDYFNRYSARLLRLDPSGRLQATELIKPQTGWHRI